MLNPFGIILFYELVGWFDGQDINEKNWNSNVVIHIDKKIHGSLRIHVKSIWYHIVLRIGGVVWWPRH